MFDSFLPSLRRKSQEPSKREPDFFDLFEEFVRAPFGGTSGEAFGNNWFQENLTPSLDVSETDQEVQIKVDVPGLDKKDLELSLENNALVIRGKTENEHEEKKDNYIHRERRFGSIYRSIPLPDYVDTGTVAATCDKGVLTVKMQKLPEKMPRHIAVE